MQKVPTKPKSIYLSRSQAAGIIAVFASRKSDSFRRQLRGQAYTKRMAVSRDVDGFFTRSRGKEVVAAPANAFAAENRAAIRLLSLALSLPNVSEPEKLRCCRSSFGRIYQNAGIRIEQRRIAWSEFSALLPVVEVDPGRSGLSRTHS
jgi:hypothetical protein